MKSPMFMQGICVTVLRELLNETMRLAKTRTVDTFLATLSGIGDSVDTVKSWTRHHGADSPSASARTHTLAALVNRHDGVRLVYLQDAPTTLHLLKHKSWFPRVT